MKIGILTWYKTVNHGAVLQAYALKSFLETQGHKVLMLDYERHIPAFSHLSHRIKCIPAKLKRMQDGEDAAIKIFNKNKKTLFGVFCDSFFQSIPYSEAKSLDAVFVGSDQVFDIRQGYNSYMLGYGVDCDNLFAYAPCAAQTDKDFVHAKGLDDEFRKGFAHFRLMSARDENTKKLIAHYSDFKNAPIVIDPVLMYGFEEERKNWNYSNFLKGKRYMVIYAYSTYLNSRKEIEPIIKYAKEKGLLTVALGYFHDWCDISVCASPMDYLSIINNAEKVVTDTFHGTVFSMTCGVDFCSIVRTSSAGNSNKLGYLIRQFEVTNMQADNASKIYDILSSDIDWDSINNRISLLRNHSRKYIELCLNTCLTIQDTPSKTI